MSVRIVHTADFHLDSAFASLSPEQARQRRRESRELLERLKNYVNQNDIDIVLLAGDLFDGESTYRETIEQLISALSEMRAHVFIAPGNHDFYNAKSPYATLSWPENVHIFKNRAIERVDLPELSCAVYGAAFIDVSQERSLLADFSAPDDGLIHLMVLHGDLNAAEARYNPVTKEQIAASRMDYLALGHTHLHDGIHQAGETFYAYSGCPEGRGFDELGEKGILSGTVDRKKVDIKLVPFTKRRYEIIRVDSSHRDARSALREALPECTTQDIYRVIFTGESDEKGIDLAALQEEFASWFYHLELRDETHFGEDIWSRAEEDSLRGLFLKELRAKYDQTTDSGEREKIECAVRFGLAALDGRDV